MMFTAKTINSWFNSVLQESMQNASLAQKARKEQENQENTVKKLGKEESKQENETSKTVLDELEKVESKGETTSQDIIDALNRVRSGHSLSHGHTGSLFDQYVNSLSRTEKVALLSFLKGIAQIVTGEKVLAFDKLEHALIKAIKSGKGDIETQHLVDALNHIRSGHSFQSEEVSKDLHGYINSIGKKKSLLLAFLNGISQIAVGEVQDASEVVTTEAAEKSGNEKSKLAKGDVSADDIVSKLNSIRSGKSFKDESISGSLRGYVNALSKAEKTALFAFLKGIAQIVTGEVSAEEAMEPEDKPADVSMKKGESSAQQTKHIEPNVIKTNKQSTEKKTAPAEDTSPPAPIKPKR